ncbi:hypothetical protein [Inquilinus sp. OTU3971]|uniref:hypothetical protein n=1 Tax=Inquilinus sp. OTU3971 TaxID=3043855 RepID=UPI00313D4353
MPYRQLYSVTPTEILALQLHRNLRGPTAYSDDIRALVDELERRHRRSEHVEVILNDGRQYLAGRKSTH